METDLNNLILNIVDDDGLAEEGLGQLVSFGILASVLSAAGIVEGATFNKNIQRYADSKPGTTLTITKSELGDIVEMSRKKGSDQMVGKWRLDKAVNVIARTLYMEARNQGMKGLRMVMSVIWNRAGGDKGQLSEEALKWKQFSCWNYLGEKTSARTAGGYSIQFPKGVMNGKGGADAQMWDVCQKLAQSAFDGSFTPDNPEWNAYFNPDKANPDWDKNLKNTEMVGSHKVGTLKWYKTTGKAGGRT